MSEIPGQPSEQTPEEGVSLRELSEAFAQAMGVRAGPEAEVEPEETESQPADTQPADTQPADKAPLDRPPQPEEHPAEDQPPDEDGPCPVSPKTILEAMLFLDNRENRPLESRRAAELMRDVEPGEIPVLVDQLNRQYAAGGCPYHIVSEGSGYRMTLRKSFGPLRNRFYGRIREARLSQAAVDVLAIVAYQQPLTAEKVSRLRGRPSGHLLTQLVRRRLLRIERPEGKPRRAHYYTTDRFLELFGLESLDDLPQSEELEEPVTDE